MIGLLLRRTTHQQRRCFVIQLTQHNVQPARSITASAASEHAGPESKPVVAKDIKSALRLLYKLVHPDLFQEHPLQKDTNERSFKLLQEYLLLARGSSDVHAHGARAPYRFSFYLSPRQPDPEHESDDDEVPTASGRSVGAPRSEDDTAPSTSQESRRLTEQHFQHVQIVLPPPTPGQHARSSSSSSGNGSGGKTGNNNNSDLSTLSPPTRKSLLRLLSACGLEVDSSSAASGDWGHGLGGYPARPAGGTVGPPLSSWLPAAMEELRQDEAAVATPALRLANLRGAFRLVRQVLVSFADVGRPVQQVAALESLAHLLQAQPEMDIRGCRIVFGERMALDRRGTLHLALHDGPHAWLEFLQQVDLAFVKHQRQTFLAVQALELSVARALGVSLVQTPAPSFTMEATYRQLLERWADGAASRGHAGGGRFHLVTISVIPPGPQTEAVHEGLDEETGVLRVATGADAAQVYRLLQSHGDKAMAIIEDAKAREADERALISRVRQQLRLRRLHRHADLAPDHFRHACRQLLEHSAALAHTVEGSSMKVGFVNSVTDGCLEVAWNFEL